MAPRLLALIAAGFFLTGCVAQDKDKALELETQALKEQLQRAEAAWARNGGGASAWNAPASNASRPVADGNEDAAPDPAP